MVVYKNHRFSKFRALKERNTGSQSVKQLCTLFNRSKGPFTPPGYQNPVIQAFAYSCSHGKDSDLEWIDPGPADHAASGRQTDGSRDSVIADRCRA